LHNLGESRPEAFDLAFISYTFSLQTRSLVEPLFHKITSDFVPAARGIELAENPSHINSSAIIRPK
jgi:hypothetical protein